MKCLTTLGCIIALALLPVTAFATDYFLTIGGGYRPEGNQASLEANVLFFQDVLSEQHRGSRTQAVFFADGLDPEADLQVLRERSSEAVAETPATDLLTELYSFRGAPDVDYRNHQVPFVSGPNAPSSIKGSLISMAAEMKSGDRLIVYVTAHGGQAKGQNKYNTSISCWNDESITAREFESWLDNVPANVPVVMVMAQCYCGGFAHAIFDKANSHEGPSPHLRAGFFAQQHDLPAAGCRPDIDNDEEYSSFFWGALVSRSRTGRPMPSADYDQSGAVSFAEAHALALLASDTIDIPLRTSEALLRASSRIAGYDHRRDPPAKQDNNAERTTTESAVADRQFDDGGPLASMVGSLREIVAGGSPELVATVASLAEQLSIDFDADVPVVFMRFQEERDQNRELRHTSYRSRRSRGSGRRELREEVAERWPDLANRRTWRAASILGVENQQQLMREIEELPSYERFREYRERRELETKALQAAELREVKFQRLINTLEAIVLARNLPKVAAPEVVRQYEAILAIENSHLAASVTNPKPLRP